MIYNPDFKQQEIARHAFNLKRHLAGKSYPSARESGTPWFCEAKESTRQPDRVTDNVDHYYADQTMKALDILPPRSPLRPTREAHKSLARHHKRVSLVLQNLVIWGAVLWAIWFLFL